jgi:Tfp pilus assembly protein PilF
VNLGATYLQLKRPDQGAAEFRAALAVEPRNADAIVNLALAQTAAGQPADARGTLLRALTVDPRSAAAHYNLALEYEQEGEISRAVDHYRAFLQFAGPAYAGLAPDVRARIDALVWRLKQSGSSL